MNEMFTMSILRKMKGLGAKEVEDDLGWTRGRLGQLECNARQINDAEFKQLRQYFKISEKTFNKFHLEFLLIFNRINR